MLGGFCGLYKAEMEYLQVKVMPFCLAIIPSMT
jgi:hypothetical protein